MFTVDVFPAKYASKRDTYRIEIVLEAVNGGTWDTTDEVEGRLRYRLCRATRPAAETTATELIAMGLNADVTLGLYEQEAASVAPASSSPHQPTHAPARAA